MSYSPKRNALTILLISVPIAAVALSALAQQEGPEWSGQEQSAQPQSAESQPCDPQMADPGTDDVLAGEPQFADSKVSDPPRQADPQHRQSQPADLQRGNPQVAGGQQQAREFTNAEEIASLITQGQLNLRTATEMAEKHSKGTALEAKCELQFAPSIEHERSPSADSPTKMGSTNERHVVYEVSCFTNGKLQTIHVDGLTKKVCE
ncbi:MAG: hypothetical protein HY287_18325 [Planctomycetes bacterium]|nr:hypothetical protein [Planctomycetota bacterium]MBI3836279.1 hypothetical protein [Planctomycetota bacterium]